MIVSSQDYKPNFSDLFQEFEIRRSCFTKSEIDEIIRILIHYIGQDKNYPLTVNLNRVELLLQNSIEATNLISALVRL